MARKDAPKPSLQERIVEGERHLCRCAYQGMRCQFFWVISEFTNGTPGVCNRHNGVKYGDPRYSEIIEESHEWARRRQAA